MKYTRCQVFSPNNAHATLYADEMSELLEIDIVPVGTAEEAVIGADVVLAASAVNSPHENPVLQGAWLEPGMHVASIGGRAELDDAVVTRCDAIVIDSKSQFPHECFDVTSQVERGLLAWDDVAELHEVIAGNRIGRRSLDDITLVKTVGTPLQDLLPAVVTYEAARKEGCGTDLGDAFPPSGGWYV
jgi:ornithine cyclodeaminase/alanine dehydrogenase-like protein (mu-crystallin family)